MILSSFRANQMQLNTSIWYEVTTYLGSLTQLLGNTNW